MQVKRLARGPRPHGRFPKWDLWDEMPRDDLPPPPSYTCRRCARPPVIDGRLHDEAWQEAEWSPAFADIDTGTPASLDTRIALLWDDTCLYVGARLEDHDIRASMSGFHEHVYLQDEDFEVFVEGRDGYYEMGLNAIDSTYEIRWSDVDAVIKKKDWRRLEELLKTPNSLLYIFEGGAPRSRQGDLDWTLEGLQSAVLVDGSLNRPEVRDKGWTVELAFPWQGLEPVMGAKAVPPEEGQTLRMNAYRAHHHRDRPDGSYYWEAWTWSRQGCNLIHHPDRWVNVVFRE